MEGRVYKERNDTKEGDIQEGRKDVKEGRKDAKKGRRYQGRKEIYQGRKDTKERKTSRTKGREEGKG